MPTCLRLLLPALCLSMVACGYTNLEGEYEGEVECDGGAVDVDLEIEETGTAFYDATMQIWPITLNGTPTAFDVEFGIEQMAPKGGQTLEIDDAVCVAFTESGATSQLDCSGFSELGFDGENTLSADISNFLATGLDCTLTLER